MHTAEHENLTGDILVTNREYYTTPFILTVDTARWLWDKIKQYRTLFSDTTYADIDNFVRLVTLPNSLWYAIWKEGDTEPVGILYVTDIQPSYNATMHVMFFDRKFSDKVDICKEQLKYVFVHTHIHRATAIIPDIYHATRRFAERVGFKQEGVQRETISIGGQWRDEYLYGLLQTELA